MVRIHVGQPIQQGSENPLTMHMDVRFPEIISGHNPMSGAGTRKACCSRRLKAPFQERYWVR